MKHLLTLAVLLVSTLSLAQFTPYNPDADNDQFVGAQDLLAFLPLFGEDWNLDSLTIYGISELEIPEFCFYPGNEQNCSIGNWRLVPQDADIVYWDLEGGTSHRLFLPEMPKPMLVFGTSSSSQLTNQFAWWDENQQLTSYDVYTLTEVDERTGATMLLNFDGKWWSIGL